MLTRCPHCQTHFRVTPEQLKARQGQVRCGSCQRVFDALESLSDEVVSPPATPATIYEEAAADPLSCPPEAIAEAEPADLPPEAAAPQEIPAEATADTLGALIAEEAAPPLPQDFPAPEEAPEAIVAEEPAESRRSPDGAATEESPEASAEEAQPEAWESVPETPPARRWPWAAGSLVLILLAVLQLAFMFRIELAVLAPGLRPVLTAGSALFGSTLPYPRKPELIGIEASDLAPAGTDRLLLSATLKNRAPFDQEYPYLELTLTDTQDAALVRKVLAPADYLPADRPAQAGFASHAELPLKLTIEAPGVPAAGYRLYLFYP